MNTKKSVFNKLFGKKSLSKTELKNVKVDLNVIQNIITEYEPFEQSESETSYFAYEYGDEAIEAYEEWRRTYDIDNYVVNGAMTGLPDTVDYLRENLAELDTAAENLGISPQEILDNSASGIDYNDLKSRLDSAESLYNDAKDKMRELSSYTGIPDFLN